MLLTQIGRGCCFTSLSGQHRRWVYCGQNSTDGSAALCAGSDLSSRGRPPLINGRFPARKCCSTAVFSATMVIKRTAEQLCSLPEAPFYIALLARSQAQQQSTCTGGAAAVSAHECVFLYWLLRYKAVRPFMLLLLRPHPHPPERVLQKHFVCIT